MQSVKSGASRIGDSVPHLLQYTAPQTDGSIPDNCPVLGDETSDGYEQVASGQVPRLQIPGSSPFSSVLHPHAAQR